MGCAQTVLRYSPKTVLLHDARMPFSVPSCAHDTQPTPHTRNSAMDRSFGTHRPLAATLSHEEEPKK